jgi:hypothetical protein
MDRNIYVGAWRADCVSRTGVAELLDAEPRDDVGVDLIVAEMRDDGLECGVEASTVADTGLVDIWIGGLRLVENLSEDVGLCIR